LSGRLFLIIWISYLTLSCSEDRYNKNSSTEALTKNIKERLLKKNYIDESELINPYQKTYGTEASKFLSQLHENKFFESLDFQKIKDRYSQRKSPFQLASYSGNESETWGIDNPTNFDYAVQEITQFYQGHYTEQEIFSILQPINQVAAGYSLDYLGAQSFFNDRYSDGSLTYAQSEILKSELSAIYQCTSISQALNVIATVEAEVLQSQMSESEKSKILISNSIMREGIIANQYTSNLTDETSDTFQQTGAVALFLGGMILFCVGCAMIISAGINENQSLGGLGTVVALCGIMVGLVAGTY